MAKKQFKAESKRLLDLMINSIYTNREIFLRELISNASDAEDKLCYRALTDGNVGMTREDFEIRVSADKENRTLTVSDNGIGMDKEALEDNLGVIAKSGSLKFKQELSDDEKNDVDIIGQFGVGFYSAFMVSDTVTVISRAYGSDTAYRWESSGADGYTITECEKETVGTDIIMHIKEDTEEETFGEFLEEYTLRSLIKKYSDYIRYPIKMNVTKSRPVEKPGADENAAPEYEQYTENETINSMVPLWHKNKTEVTEEEYNRFYKDMFMDYEDPAASISVKTEGAVSYEALLFIPAKAPYDFYSKDYEKGLKLYSGGVMIMEKCADLLPEHFRFVRGVVDSEDLSLNISREMLQQNRQLTAIAASLEKKIKRELLKMLKDNREKYEKFFESFGLQLKYGVVNDYGAHKDLLSDLLMFRSSDEGRMITLKEYVDLMKEEQEYIYYACGETAAKIAALPQTEYVIGKGCKVLYLTDDVDEFVMQALGTFGEKKLKSVKDEDIAGEEEKEQAEKADSENRELLDFMQTALGGEVGKVRACASLGAHPVSLTSEGGITLEMEKYFAKMPMGEGMKASRVLEVNTEHGVFAALKKAFESDKERAEKITKVLYAQAQLMAGFTPADPTEYTDTVCSLIAE